MRISKLTLNGQPQPMAILQGSDHPDLVLETSILVTPPVRGEDNQVQLHLTEDHLIELVFDDTTTWLDEPDQLEQLYPGQLSQQRGAEDGFQLPLTLDTSRADRGLVQQIALKVVNLFTKKAAARSMRAIAEELERHQLNEGTGLLRVSPSFGLTPFDTTEAITGPVLLFIHGTNSSTAGSFRELVTTHLWEYITRTYNNNILAFNHETLTKSPLQNATELAAQLPAGADLHIITHSRGGLVGEILARCNPDVPGPIAFSEKEISYLEKENRGDDIKYIRQLQEIYRQKKFKTSRFIRVACPTAGTTIVSDRLVNFLNISLNLIGIATGIAGSAIYTILKSLLVAAIDEKNDTKVLPGLEAMNPDSPFITVLNDQDTLITDSILVVSGNTKAKVNLKALLILTERLFFAESNDLVVNTSSMYAGSRRANKLKFFFDEGTDVDHFHYFKNETTNNAIRIALESPDKAIGSGFTEFTRGGAQTRNAIIGPGGDYTTSEPDGKRDIVVLLPGIMGSCLEQNFETIWLDYFRILKGGLSRIDLSQEKVQPNAIVSSAYRRLGEALKTDYDVVAFPFDWRQSSKDAAGELEKRIKELIPKMAPGKSVKIVAHSLGGVVVRDLMVFYPETWQRLNSSKDFRLLFLGSPLMGAFRIVNVLFGEDDIIRKLSKLDLLSTKKDLLKMFSRFPGIIGLLPLTKDKDNDFANDATWSNMAAAFGDPGWPVPKDGLEYFQNYRDAVTEAMKNPDFRNAIYIAGRYKETPVAYRIDTKKDKKELVFLSTAEGDQSVTWDSGIPQSMIDKNQVYYVNHTHGELSDSPDMFSGIKEILEKGKTTLFATARPVVRGDQRMFRKPATADFDFSEEGVERTLLGLTTPTEAQPSQIPIRVSIAHGDLKYAKYPVLAGHFKRDSILYAEKRIDQLLEGQLEERNRLGIYPGDLGTSELMLTHTEDGFQGAVIVGLGESDRLTPFSLSLTAEQAISKYLLAVNAKSKSGAQLRSGAVGLSPLVIGCGFGGLSIDSSIHAILQGTMNANSKISGLYGEKAHLIEEIEFVELYQDRVLGCYYAIKRIAGEMSGGLNIIPVQDGIRERNGARQKVNIDQGKDWWNRITVVENKDDSTKGMLFSISTGGAREELQKVYTTGGVVERLLETISVKNSWDKDKAATIFELLMPNAFKARMKRHGNITWVLDDYTAGFPWELLQHKGEDVKPLCINAGMIRQLATSTSRLNIETVTTNTALVIGDPNTNGFLPQLDAALEEAKSVADLLRSYSFDTNSLLNAQEDAIIPALIGGSYKIIHLAGHGIFDPEPDKSGMVIGENSFLTTRQIAQMSDTPDLVFVNCCYLGKIDKVAEEYYQSRFRLAANIGTQLIDNGVKAVVVAGWAVDDAEARRFATVFYQNMFMGRAFGEAVRLAREAVYNSNSRINTWGAYQCYGNPFYRLKAEGRYQEDKQYVISEQAEIDLQNLDSDMRTGDHPADQLLTRLTAISDEVDRSSLRTPVITELEAKIYKSLGKYDLSLKKYEQLVQSREGGYSFEAVELYCNLRSKLLLERIVKKEPSDQLEKEFDKLHLDLQALILLSPTVTRYNILGSAWKRRTALYLGDRDRLIDAVKRSALYYSNAANLTDRASSFCNWIALQNLLIAAGVQQWGQTPDIPTLQAIDERLSRLLLVYGPGSVAKKFEDWIALANLKLAGWLVQSVCDGCDVEDHQKLDTVAECYRDIWEKAGSAEDKLSDIQHLQLLIDALTGLAAEHFMIARMKILLERLKQYNA